VMVRALDAVGLTGAAPTVTVVCYKSLIQ
jgi:hypothetical protein